MNNHANDGTTIHLAPGTYILSATNSEGVARPSHGALRLRPGMSLVGSEQRTDYNFDGVPDPPDPNDPDIFAVSGTETKIDGSFLTLPEKVRTNCASTSTKFIEPVIAINRDVSISSLYLYGENNIAIGEPENPIDSVESYSVTIQNTVLDSFLIPLTFANAGCERSHARSTLIFSHNVLRNGGFFGLTLFNFITGTDADDTSNGPQINATISFNLFYNNPGTAFGPRGGNIGTDGGLTTVAMTGNIFRNNGRNILGIGGGGGRPALSASVGNRLQLTSRFDTFGESSSGDSSIVLIAGAPSNIETQHSQLNVRFFNTSFIRDTPANPDSPDIFILGGESSSDNHAWVLIRKATVKTSAGAPTFGTLTIQHETVMGSIPNTAKLMGSREDFLRLNQGFHAPAAKYFVKK